MSELLDCQRDFVAALRDAHATAPALEHLAGDAALTERRLSIYRANAAAAVEKALGAAYPVCAQVLGAEAFEILARAYRQARPSSSGDLNEMGDALPEVVASHEIGQSLPYLADLARLEWAAHRAYGAADAAPFDASGMSNLPASEQATIRFAWAPGTALVESPFPIARIWRIHQPDYEGEFSVDWSAGEAALIAREGLRVTVQSLSRGEAAFARASLDGHALGSALERALAEDAEFQPGQLLARLISANTICGYTTGQEK